MSENENKKILKKHQKPLTVEEGCIYDCKKERPDPPVALRKRFE